MPDPSGPEAGGALLATAFRPRRLGFLMGALRRLAWPILRGWLLPISAELNRLAERSRAQEAANASLREELAAARTALAALQARMLELSDTTARDTARSDALAAANTTAIAIETIRREVVALGNVVAHYRELIDSALPSKVP